MRIGLLIQDLTSEEIEGVLKSFQSYKTKPLKKERYCKRCIGKYEMESLKWNDDIKGYVCVECRVIK